ncbi:hypothetical protein AQV86_03435 [Nanohaloarchaea archaeon SG9]|nr:hypothetical protein AQV86_03435 [Nanohaloarchaea archaeon SG9]
MAGVDVAEAEDVLESGEKLVEDIDRENETVEVLKIRLDDLRHEIEKESGKLEEAVKDVKDLMEKIDEGSVHQEPEMTPEKEREAREEGPRDEEYR